MILSVLTFPDKRLRIKAKVVKSVDKSIQTLVSNMFETMYVKNGIGLAATQVDVHQQVIVIDVPSFEDYQALQEQRDEGAISDSQNNDQNNPLCFINPTIVDYHGQVESKEGCLSVPGFQANVTRCQSITVKALNEKGEAFELCADGLLAICIQHEIDHLRGKLFVDYLSKLKQCRLKKKLARDGDT